ncbi:MAG: sigma-54 dependent transcriptional regulator [Candidatus Krumholzibacteria bacterium]|jgi:two-component system response regulator AtoC|nr:sigma-54 dependent transcriptional regulator [Candidatus Krumholzibacteria bacterium]MDP6798158.1 sigma-54 dependent transcriptional regulator [Candidatus Krumholzibacteria bacterium]MDP7021995.1 sigma-54 dependent transcriptional regulator [Candidatus Krumholzibacteria bacterium]
MPDILIVDDDRAIRRSLELHLKGRGMDVRAAVDLADAEAQWEEATPDLVILDLMLPDGEGLDLLERRAGDSARVVMITGHHDMEKAVRAMQLGAFDYVHKPVSVDEIDTVLDRALKQIREEQGAELAGLVESEGGRSGEIVGRSRAILELHKDIGRASRGGANLLLLGESGTGKELVARALHRNLSPDHPFVPVNCSALVPTLLESELFGHERGAFTGASQRRLGRMELAGEGVLFLDEIGDLSGDLQVKLLRVLQEKEFERVGGAKPLPFRATLLAATHRDLEKMVEEGEFREDLYFRLRVMEIRIPSLRERREDIPLLVDHFLARYNRELHRNVQKLSAETLEQLLQWDWPGNVRELENRVLAGIMASSGEVLEMEIPDKSLKPLRGDWERSLRDLEAEHIARVLVKTGWNLGRSCEILGISRPTLRKKIEDHGLKESFNG